MLEICKDRLQVLEVCGVVHRNFLVVNKLRFEMSVPLYQGLQSIPIATSADIEKCSGIGHGSG